MILSAVLHPHILPLRGACRTTSLVDPGHFVVLDRVRETLAERIHQWQRQSRRAGTVVNRLRGVSDRRLAALRATALWCAANLAGALAHLHASR